MKKKSQAYFKLSADDVLSIVNDYLEEKISWGAYNSKLSFILDDDKDIRVIAAYGDMNDQSIDTINLEELDKEIDFNGEVSTLPDSFLLNPQDFQTREKVRKRIEELKKDIGDF